MGKLLYITFIDFGDYSSGSSVRPQKMYTAFLEKGESVTLLSGANHKRHERKIAVKQMRAFLSENTVDYCYIEPPSGPFFCYADLSLLKMLHKKHVAISIFYRDAYYKFPDFWGKKGFKKFFLRLMHARDNAVFKKVCSTVYFPTKKMSQLFSFKEMDILPPGAVDNLPTTRVYNSIPTAVYAGGLSHYYGADIMLDALELINKDSVKCRLNLICRPDEYAPYKERIERCPYIAVQHISGDELREVYYNSDFALLTLRKNFYADFCMPVKIMESISHGLPLVATNCEEIAKFITQNDIGIIVNDNAEDFAEGIKRMMQPESITHFASSIRTALPQHLWTSRAEKVIDDFTKSEV